MVTVLTCYLYRDKKNKHHRLKRDRKVKKLNNKPLIVNNPLKKASQH